MPPPVNVPPMLENNATQHDALLAAQIYVFAGEAAPPIELASGSGDAPVDAAVMLPDDDREAAAFWASYFWRRRRKRKVLESGGGWLPWPPTTRASCPATLNPKP